MNILVLPYGKNKVICRPDTTWERENKDIFIPDDVTGFDYSPIQFARVCKAGKSIGIRFADRYYDSINFGVLLYPKFSDNRDCCLAELSCMDHTSILPFPLYNKVTLENGNNSFKLYCEDRKLFSTSNCSCAALNELAVTASRYTSLRIGDLICIELQKPESLFDTTSQDKDTYIRATFCENETFNLKIRI